MPTDSPAHTSGDGDEHAPATEVVTSRTTLVLQIVLQVLLVIHTIIGAGGGSGC